MAAHKDVTSVEAFKRLWTRTGEPHAAATASAGRDSLTDALAAAADARGPATYRASLPYASDAGVDAGVYYLGDAWASTRFAAFVRGLDWPRPAARLALRSIAPELDAFDREVTTAYEKMDRSQHAGYIQTSVAIKQARTLDEAHQYAGALLEYLLARYRFGLLRTPGATVDPDAVRAARERFPISGDHGIAELFLQMADRALADPAPSAHRAAAVILNDVLPAYAAATATPSVTTAAAASPQVTITLVRWPFT
jgi:hypothetical protein